MAIAFDETILEFGDEFVVDDLNAAVFGALNADAVFEEAFGLAPDRRRLAEAPLVMPS